MMLWHLGHHRDGTIVLLGDLLEDRDALIVLDDDWIGPRFRRYCYCLSLLLILLLELAAD